MASKQLGKLRQWAGEVISRDKTHISDEFCELEEDIDLRRHGVKRLLAASTAYHRVLAKKRDCTSFLDDPAECLPVDALGMVMITHGEEFPEDSAFGSSLIKLGRAHCQIATLQEAYAVAFQGTFLDSVETFVEEMKDCKFQRKKLESRRLSYDATISKLEKLKNTKKEKDKKEAEDELQQAKLRYEEMSEEVRARMRAIQENEIDQLRELTAFLDLEMHFVAQYAEVLTNVKAEWCNDSIVKKCDLPKGHGPLHVFSRSPAGSRPSSRANADDDISPAEDSEDDSRSQPSSSRKSSLRLKSGTTSKETSRPNSRSSRSRSASAVGSVTDKEKEKEKDKDKEKSEKPGRKLTVAGWASSAVGSVTKRSKDKFAALTGGGNGERLSGDEEAEAISQSFPSFTLKKASKSRSKDSLGTSSPKARGQILKMPPPRPPTQDKLVRALRDFVGSPEELSFKAGDEILVVNEVLDDWWMGELDGRKGLFPTGYTEVITPSPSTIAVASTITRPGASVHAKAKGEESDGSSSSSEDTSDEFKSSDVEGEQLFRASYLIPTRSPFYGYPDTASITSSTAEEEEHEKPTPAIGVLPPSLMRARAPSAPSPDKGPSTVEPAVKKTPPPPPPRRSANNGLPGSPPIPNGRPSMIRSRSSPATAAAPMLRPSPSTSSQEYETSPFESAVDFTGTGCGEFNQNPFKPRGMCSNCFALHA